VVVVDVEVPLTLQLNVEAAVLRQLLDHVVQKPNPRGHLAAFPRAVEVDLG
jgi:hypothetical protein